MHLDFDDIRGLLILRADGHDRVPRVGAARSTRSNIPYRLAFDLDPDVGLDFGKVKEAAVRLRGLLKDLCAHPRPSRCCPAARACTSSRRSETRHRGMAGVSEYFAEPVQPRAIAEAEPEMFTANIRKVPGRIFLDWLRNQRGVTAVMPYSAQPAKAPPSPPLSPWTPTRRRQSWPFATRMTCRACQSGARRMARANHASGYASVASLNFTTSRVRALS